MAGRDERQYHLITVLHGGGIAVIESGMEDRSPPIKSEWRRKP
jgi:hypothetical protein